MAITNENSTSLNKFISDSGFCSRREADVIIKAGRVTINGIVAMYILLKILFLTLWAEALTQYQ